MEISKGLTCWPPVPNPIEERATKKRKKGRSGEKKFSGGKRSEDYSNIKIVFSKILTKERSRDGQRPIKMIRMRKNI